MERADIDDYFKRVQNDLSEKLAEAEALLAQIKQALDESTQNRRETSDVLSNINKSYQQVVELIAKIQADLDAVSELRTRALDPDTGIEVIINKVQALSTKATTLNSKIDEIRKSVESSQTEIKKLLESSTKDKIRISENATSADEVLGKINEIYQLATDTGLAGSFDKRTKNLEQLAFGWRKRFSGSLILLGVVLAVVMAITFLDSGIKLDGLTIIRFALLTPLVVYVGFSAIQYAKERNLLEKYAFKATTALALDSYTRLLVDKFGKEKKYEEKILDFVLLAMKDIYKEPHEEKKKTSWYLKIMNMKAKFSDEFQKIDNRLDELETNIPGDATK